MRRDFNDSQNNFVIRQADLGSFVATPYEHCARDFSGIRDRRDIASELEIIANAAYVAKSRVLRRLREDLADLFE